MTDLCAIRQIETILDLKISIVGKSFPTHNFPQKPRKKSSNFSMFLKNRTDQVFCVNVIISSILNLKLTRHHFTKSASKKYAPFFEIRKFLEKLF